MKLMFLVGNTAVGKMTVGQELTKITELRLFYNHMTIETVIEIFGNYNQRVTDRLREVIFEEFAASDCYGLIFTCMMDFDMQSDWDYIEHVKDIFRKHNADTEFFFVELTAPQHIRLERNATENRLLYKASKRDIAASNQRLINADLNHRCESYEGEVPFENYLRIDNSSLSPQVVAEKIKKAFNL